MAGQAGLLAVHTGRGRAGERERERERSGQAGLQHRRVGSRQRALLMAGSFSRTDGLARRRPQASTQRRRPGGRGSRVVSRAGCRAAVSFDAGRRPSAVGKAACGRWFGGCRRRREVEVGRFGCFASSKEEKRQEKTKLLDGTVLGLRIRYESTVGYGNLSGNTDTRPAGRSDILVLRCEDGRKKGRKGPKGLREWPSVLPVAGEGRRLRRGGLRGGYQFAFDKKILILRSRL